MRSAAGTRGVTLVEMLVVLTILSLVFGVSTVALASLRAPREAASARALREARDQAIRTGDTVRATLPSPAPDVRHSVLFLPDGRALGARVDPLTGVPRE
ncbi:MAG TPA: prepilin-type N-terminal cleavage/methylation domain-containing protein [Gemmatimonadales bacterium]|nr:prepilin-type N-terminal cleavage/methylation domain-containing protein [Gemmatimonadales bacterium]